MTAARCTVLRRLAIGSILILAGSPAFSIEHIAVNHGALDHAQMQKRVTSTMTEGEVRKVDVELGKITIKHADIKNLAMPAMTMVFTAANKALLSEVKAGDRVRFAAANENGKLLVTAIEPLQVE